MKYNNIVLKYTVLVFQHFCIWFCLDQWSLFRFLFSFGQSRVLALLCFSDSWMSCLTDCFYRSFLTLGVHYCVLSRRCTKSNRMKKKITKSMYICKDIHGGINPNYRTTNSTFCIPAKKNNSTFCSWNILQV